MRFHTQRALAAVALWQCVLAATVSGQVATKIDASRGASCPGCTIELSKVTSIGSPNDPDMIGIGLRVAMDSRGRLFAMNQDRKAIVAYGADGKFIKTIGRPGQGPGELMGMTGAELMPGDSLLVLNGERITIFSPRMEYVRQFPVTSILPVGVVPFASGSMAIETPMQSRVARFPIHLVSPRGDITRSFGSEADTIMPDCTTCRTRVPFPARQSGTMWTVRPNDYVIEKWDTAGKMVRRVSVVGSSWFQPWWTSTGAFVSPRWTRPVTTVQRLAEDANGRLWVASRAAVTNWKADPRQPTPPPPNTQRGGSHAKGQLDSASTNRVATMIEILDPSTGRLYLSQRFDKRDLFLISSEYAASIREDDDGFPIMDIWRLRVVTANRGDTNSDRGP